MRAFISISKSLVFSLLLLSTGALAADVDEDEFAPSPFTDYGEFNQEAEEEAEARFFQHGRFFGVSVGLGMEAVSGNRGVLWQGGFPTFDLKLHYWFDFNVALDLGFYTSPHFYKTDAGGLGSVDANMTWVGVDLKYYVDTKNLSAPISFANPYLLLGAGGYTKTETSLLQGQPDPDTSVGLSGGLGIEFPIKHRAMYFSLESKIHLVHFRDTNTDDFLAENVTPHLDNLSGQFYTLSGSLLFTW